MEVEPSYDPGPSSSSGGGTCCFDFNNINNDIEQLLPIQDDCLPGIHNQISVDLGRLSLPQIDESLCEDLDMKARDRLVRLLDQLETHVERLRKDAMHLEEEKDNLLSTLDTLRNSDLLDELNENEQDDIQRYADRIAIRCQTVEVLVRTNRDKNQEEALFQVNHLIDTLVVGLKGDPKGTKDRCLAFMNACSEHIVQGITDKKFETALLGCTLDDQKRIKKRLQGLLNYFDKINVI